MDEIITKVKAMDGHELRDNKINIICYADYAVLIADSEHILQRLLHRFNITTKKFNIAISVEKTKSLVVSIEPM